MRRTAYKLLVENFAMPVASVKDQCLKSRPFGSGPGRVDFGPKSSGPGRLGPKILPGRADSKKTSLTLNDPQIS